MKREVDLGNKGEEISLGYNFKIWVSLRWKPEDGRIKEVCAS